MTSPAPDQDSALQPRPSLRHPANLLATWFGAGWFPFAPGTMGSFVAVIIAWPIRAYLGLDVLFAALIVVFVLGVWAAGHYSKASGKDDDGAIVIDEVAGQWITLLLVPADPVLYAIGFVLFRAADIVKPWPISLADRKIGGGFGVMFDDVLAGVLAALILWNIWMWAGI